MYVYVSTTVWVRRVVASLSCASAPVGIPSLMFNGDKPRGSRPVAGVDGNWSCTTCATVNFASRTECHYCRRPFPGGTMPMGGMPDMSMGMGGLPHSHSQMPPGGPGGGPPKLSGAPVEGIGGNWRCNGCANVNFAKREHCNRCQTPRPPLEQILQREQELEQERAVAAATGAALSTPTAPGVRAGKFAPPVAGIDGNWECTTCNSVNFASRETCHRCQAARPPQSHIKARAEQLKTERAVQLAASANSGPPPLGPSLCAPMLGGGQPSSSFPGYYGGFPDSMGPGQPSPSFGGPSNAFGAGPPNAFAVGDPYANYGQAPSAGDFDPSGHAKRQRVEENSFANGGIARGLPMRGADCAPWVSVNGLVYLSALSGASIVGFTEGCDLPHSSAQAQTLAALANVDAMLNAAGTNKYNLVDVVVSGALPFSPPLAGCTGSMPHDVTNPQQERVTHQPSEPPPSPQPFCPLNSGMTRAPGVPARRSWSSTRATWTWCRTAGRTSSPT